MATRRFSSLFSLYFPPCVPWEYLLQLIGTIFHNYREYLYLQSGFIKVQLNLPGEVLSSSFNSTLARETNPPFLKSLCRFLVILKRTHKIRISILYIIKRVTWPSLPDVNWWSKQILKTLSNSVIFISVNCYLIRKSE